MAMMPHIMAGSPSPEHVWMVEGMLMQLVADRLRANGPLPVGESADDLLTRAVRFLDRTYVNRPSLAEIAEAAGCSPRHLHERFTTNFNCSPTVYAHVRRMQDVEHLLTTTDLPIKTIAKRCGYDDPLHFSRVVRQHFGRSPRLMRGVGKVKERGVRQ